MSSSSTPARPPIVTIDDEVEICRDERCALLEIHAKHDKPYRKRGPRSRKQCPTCKEPLARSRAGGKLVHRCEFCSYILPDPADED